ncbi:1794_t:CDS:2, partial [Acaulospora morrowiae]
LRLVSKCNDVTSKLVVLSMCQDWHQLCNDVTSRLAADVKPRCCLLSIRQDWHQLCNDVTSRLDLSGINKEFFIHLTTGTVGYIYFSTENSQIMGFNPYSLIGPIDRLGLG